MSIRISFYWAAIALGFVGLTGCGAGAERNEVASDDSAVGDDSPDAGRRIDPTPSQSRSVYRHNLSTTSYIDVVETEDDGTFAVFSADSKRDAPQTAAFAEAARRSPVVGDILISLGAADVPPIAWELTMETPSSDGVDPGSASQDSTVAAGSETSNIGTVRQAFSSAEVQQFKDTHCNGSSGWNNYCDWCYGYVGIWFDAKGKNHWAYILNDSGSPVDHRQYYYKNNILTGGDWRQSYQETIPVDGYREYSTNSRKEKRAFWDGSSGSGVIYRAFFWK